MSDSVSVKRGPPLTRRALLLRFAVASLVVGVVSGALVARLVPWLIGMGVGSSRDMQQLGAWVCISFTLVTFVTAAQTVVRTTPILKFLQRASITEDTVPPSAAAIRDASRVHRRAIFAGFISGLITPIADLLGMIDVIPLPLEERVARDLLCIAIVALGAQRMAMFWAEGLFGWLGRLHPSFVDVEPARIFAPKSGRRALLALVVVLLPGAVLAGSLTDADSFRVSVTSIAVAFAACLGAAWLAFSRAQGSASDMLTLAAAAQRFGHGDALRAPATEMTDAPTELVRKALLQFSKRIEHIAEQRSATYRAMEEAQRLKTQFFASMSHDLRSPLNSIVGFTDLLVRQVDGPLNGSQRDSVQTIQKSADELLRLLTDVLDSARLDAGRLPLTRTWIPPVELLTEALRRGKALIGDRALEIHSELQPGLPPVYVDSERIVQVIVSLFGHAARAMESGIIRVSARESIGPPGPPRHVRIDVADAGQGISERQQEIIFEAFRAITEPTGRRLGGLGLGLSLARGLTRAHGGDVWCESIAMQGTTFSVALPIERRSLPAFDD